MDTQSRLFFDIYHGLEREFDRDAAWCLVQLLRTGNGHKPLDGPEITGADVLHLYAALRVRFSVDESTYLLDSLEAGNGSVLPNGTAWPNGFRPRYGGGVEQ